MGQLVSTRCVGAYLVLASASACVTEGDARCGGGGFELERGLCVCPEGQLLEDGKCVGGAGNAEDGGAPAPDPSDDGGQSTPDGSDGGNHASAEGLGEPCEADADCDYSVNDHCQQSTAGDSYCTSTGCESNADCPADFYCFDGDDGAYCKRYPTGQGDPCSSDADCMGNDATFCTVGSPFGVVCQMRDCVDDSDCPPDLECQDFSAVQPGIPTLCGEPY